MSTILRSSTQDTLWFTGYEKAPQVIDIHIVLRAIPLLLKSVHLCLDVIFLRLRDVLVVSQFTNNRDNPGQSVLVTRHILLDSLKVTLK